jgi:oxalate decarboxylase
MDSGLLAQALGLPKEAVAGIPAAEVYIRQGDVIGRDSVEARAVHVLDARRTHRFSLMTQRPRVSSMSHRPRNIQSRRPSPGLSPD